MVNHFEEFARQQQPPAPRRDEAGLSAMAYGNIPPGTDTSGTPLESLMDETDAQLCRDFLEFAASRGKFGQELVTPDMDTLHRRRVRYLWEGRGFLIGGAYRGARIGEVALCTDVRLRSSRVLSVPVKRGGSGRTTYMIDGAWPVGNVPHGVEFHADELKNEDSAQYHERKPLKDVLERYVTRFLSTE